MIDFFDLNRKASRHPVDDHCEARPVRFARSEVTQHAGLS
jgi:hypothetical protein